MTLPRKAKLFQEILLPYVSVWFMYAICFLIIWPFFAWSRFKRKLKQIDGRKENETLICLEAGAQGWEIIEYKELLASAQEYLSINSVHKLVVDSDISYVEQVRSALAMHPITHYGWSPRTGTQTALGGAWEAVRLALLFAWYGVVPIAFLTDLPVRQWRAKSAMVTACSGVVVTLMPPRYTRLIFPHTRLIGPHIMPFSMATFNLLKNSKRLVKEPVRAVTVGAMYEPRKSIVISVASLVRAGGYELEVKGRNIESQRTTDAAYWGEMQNSGIVFTTCGVVEMSGYDWPWAEHFVYRYLEVMVAGSLLVAPNVGGIERYFKAGEHFVSYRTEAEAAQKICYYLEHPSEREAIARSGFRHAQTLVQSRSFWVGIDIALREDSLTF